MGTKMAELRNAMDTLSPTAIDGEARGQLASLTEYVGKLASAFEKLDKRIESLSKPVESAMPCASILSSMQHSREACHVPALSHLSASAFSVNPKTASSLSSNTPTH